MAGGAQADRVVAEWRANGVDVVRVFAQSTRIERWGWSELDASVARVRGAGMEPILTVVGPRVRPDKEKFAAFAGQVAARYGAVVDRYIIWNEPNLPAGCCRRRRARTGAARRSRRTSTAGSCAPPARRSGRPTRAPRC